MVAIHAIGWRAFQALVKSGGAVTVVAPLSHSLYAEAAGELIWIGEADAPLHGRAVLASRVPHEYESARLMLAVPDTAAWRPERLRIRHDARPSLANRLRAAMTAAGTPRGLAKVIVGDGQPDDLVLARARPQLAAMASACASDDSERFAVAARPLLGLGDGLTPAGDDVVGAALFARHALGLTPPWSCVIARLVADATARTHRISAQLLADLASGHGWAPLHDLTCALVRDDRRAAQQATRALARLGASSGWNLLAGLAIGFTPADTSIGVVDSQHEGVDR